MLFIDDIKLLAKTDETLISMKKETKNFCNCTTWDESRKSTNCTRCESDSVILKDHQGYKYIK